MLHVVYRTCCLIATSVFFSVRRATDMGRSIDCIYVPYRWWKNTIPLLFIDQMNEIYRNNNSCFSEYTRNNNPEKRAGSDRPVCYFLRWHVLVFQDKDPRGKSARLGRVPSQSVLDFPVHVDIYHSPSTHMHACIVVLPKAEQRPPLNLYTGQATALQCLWWWPSVAGS